NPPPCEEEIQVIWWQSRAGLADKGAFLRLGAKVRPVPAFQQINSSHRASNQHARCCCLREVRVWRPATATPVSLQPRNSVLPYPWDVPPKGCPTSPSMLPLR